MDKYHIASFVFGIFLTLSSIALFHYITTPQPQIIIEERNPNEAYLDVVSRTEYYANETGQVIVRLTDSKTLPLNATCNVTILYPDKSYLMIDQSMTASAIAGNYYRSLIIPNVLGVYEYHFKCIVNLHGKPYYLEKSLSFHVSIAYQKFQEILDKLNEINNTIANLNLSGISFNDTAILEAIYESNQTIHDKIDDLNQSIENEFNALDVNIQSKYDNIMTAIYECCRAWQDQAGSILDQLAGTGKSLNKIGDTLGLSPSTDCGLFDRLIGAC